MTHIVPYACYDGVYDHFRHHLFTRRNLYSGMLAGICTGRSHAVFGHYLEPNLISA